MHKLEVGKRYISNKSSWPETNEFNWYDGGLEYRLFYRSPTDHEIINIKRGRVRIGLYWYDGVIFFLFRSGELEWQDTPYSIHLLNPQRRPDIANPLPTEDSRFVLQIILVDADTGILKVFRVVTLSPRVSRELTKLVAEQLDYSHSVDQHKQAIEMIHQRYKTQEMARNAIVIDWAGEG